MVNYVRTLRLFNRDIHFFLLSAFLNAFSFFGIHGVLFNLYLVRLGYGTERIGLVLGVAQLAHAAFCLPAGALGARWGNRRMMITGQIVAAASLGLVPVAELLPVTMQLVWISAAYVGVWLGVTLYVVNASPFLMSACEPSIRAHVFAVRSALTPIAAVTGSLIAGWLPGALARLADTSVNAPSVYGYPLLIATGTFCIAALLLTNIRGDYETAVRTETSVPSLAAAPYAIIAVMSLIALLRSMGEGAGKSFFNVYLDTALLMPTATIGTLLAISQVLSLPVSLAMPLLVQRWGLGHTLLIGIGSMSLSLLPMALFSSGTAVSLGFMSLVAGASLTLPVLTLYTQGAVSTHWRSFMSGALTMSAAVGTALVSMVGGGVIAAQGYASLWLWASFLTACGALLFVAYQRYLRTRPQAVAPPA